MFDTVTVESILIVITTVKQGYLKYRKAAGWSANRVASPIGHSSAAIVLEVLGEGRVQLAGIWRNYRACLFSDGLQAGKRRLIAHASPLTPYGPVIC